MQGLGLDMLNATQNISSKYGYDMFTLCVKIKKNQKVTVWNSNQKKFFREFMTVTVYLEMSFS